MRHKFDSPRICKACGEEESRVTDVRERDIGMVRRRKCKACGYTYSTIEVELSELESAMANTRMRKT